jgi:hypothetical protein
MSRNTLLALTASVAIAGAALAPVSASAHPGFGFGHAFGGFGYYHGIGIYAGPVYDTCLVQRWVNTPHGLVLRWVNVCY